MLKFTSRWRRGAVMLLAASAAPHHLRQRADIIEEPEFPLVSLVVDFSTYLYPTYLVPFLIN